MIYMFDRKLFDLGDQGFYLKTTSSSRRMESIGRLAPKDIPAWTGKELAVPCFKVDVVGTTGAGDATIAGFLAGMLKGLKPDEAALMAVGTGGESVEALDSASGVHPWDSIVKRIAAGWPQSRSGVIPESWSRTAAGVHYPRS